MDNNQLTPFLAIDFIYFKGVSSMFNKSLMEKKSLTVRGQYTAFRNLDIEIQFVLRLHYLDPRRLRYLNHFCYFVSRELCQNPLPLRYVESL